MDYRIGITTRPDERKKEWQKVYPHLREWVILDQVDSKKLAKEQELRLARLMDCIPSDPDRITEKGRLWYVYRFYA